MIERPAAMWWDRVAALETSRRNGPRVRPQAGTFLRCVLHMSSWTTETGTALAKLA